MITPKNQNLTHQLALSALFSFVFTTVLPGALSSNPRDKPLAVHWAIHCTESNINRTANWNDFSTPSRWIDFFPMDPTRMNIESRSSGDYMRPGTAILIQSPHLGSLRATKINENESYVKFTIESGNQLLATGQLVPEFDPKNNERLTYVHLYLTPHNWNWRTSIRRRQSWVSILQNLETSCVRRGEADPA